MLNFLFPRSNALPRRDISEIRRICKILFVDDQKFEIVDYLRNCGWVQTLRLKDIDDVKHPSIEETHVIFVDIQGVGKKMGFEDEGLGLARALKETYPEKAIILYSAQNEGDRFHSTFSLVDDKIRKNADSYEFVKLVEKYAQRAFSLDGCLSRIQIKIKEELGKHIEQPRLNEIVHDLFKKRSQLTLEKIMGAFSITKNAAGSIYYILKTYFLL
jgi:hypothetical protein